MSISKTKPLVLVDGSSYVYRAFHALPALTNSKGEPTGAVYGVINMLRRLLDDYKPDHVAVVFDARGKTFRDEIYPEYKANRPSMPDELREQIEPLHDIVRAMGLPLLAVPGVEADDVIGTLARQASADNIPVVVSTGDKDLAQLVDANVTLVNTMSDTTLDVAGVKDKFGVPPERIIDYLALMGDTVDNVPGVPKVGPKTAAKWLASYDTLDGVVEHADEIKGKVGENLRASLEQLPLSRELVTIRCDVELEQSPVELKLGEPDSTKLAEWFARLEFKNWLRDLGTSAPAVEKSTGQVASEYETILTEEALNTWLERLQNAELFAFDTETTSLNHSQARIVGMSFAVEPGKAAYLPLAHSYEDAPAQLDRDTILARFKPLLEDPDKAKLGHHLKYDRNVLLHHGITLNGIAHDSMLESYVLDSAAHRHDMDTLCEKYLDHTNIHFADVAGKGVKQVTFDKVPIEQASDYAAEDADMTLRLHRHFWPQFEGKERQRELYENIELPLVPVLSDIESNGVLVDADLLFAQSHELADKMATIEQRAHEAAGKAFNLGSPKQIQQILYDEQQLPVLRKTPKGQPSTAEDVLQELAHEYDLPRLILEHRSMSKLKSTYTDKLPEEINPDTGRVHTSYHQAVAATGRLSSMDPNLQNIPVRTEEGRRIRRAFVPAAGRKMLALDYSQIELRIMAHLSEDKGLLDAFSQGKDIHQATAAEVFGLTPDAVSADERRAAKAINFGLIYGMSAFGLAKQLGIARGEAQDYVNLYFERYPGVKAYMDQTREKAREQGYVETLFGRRLYLPEINARNAPRRQYAERTAINAPMQGTAADIIKRAMIAVSAWLQDSKAPAVMIMQVHDELVFEVDKGAVDDVREAVSGLMTQAAELSVPLLVDAGVGDNWDEAH